MESKHQDDEEIVCRNFIDEVVDFTKSKQFSDKVDNFKRRHVSAFLDIAESKRSDEEEQKLEYTAAFNEFQEMLDELFDGFARAHNTSPQVFYQNCVDAGNIHL